MTGPELRRRIPRQLCEMLDASGLSWELKAGTRHIKVLVEGQMLVVQPLNGSAAKGVENARHIRNTMATVRRGLLAIGAKRAAGSADLSPNVGVRREAKAGKSGVCRHA